MKKVQLKINGLPRQVVADSSLSLLELLRDTLRLTGAKQSCDRKGQCGACTVIVNGKAVRSCLTRVETLEGADVITVEGLGTPDNPHLIQEAFVLAGAIQCGFCTPGMIMSAKALLDKNPNPTTEEIKHALVGNLCRCTGYVKIIEAVKLAGRFLRGEASPAGVRPDPKAGKIGISHVRPSSILKACGVAHFGADILMAGAAEIAVVRSPHAHAKIVGIDPSAALKMPGVIGIMTAKDIKGKNLMSFPPLPEDRPILCADRVLYVGDPVATVAAQTREQAVAAAEAVAVKYEVLTPLTTPQESLADDAVQLHADVEWPNECLVNERIKGDVEAALAASKFVVEETFHTQCNHQAPLEPEVSVAYFEGEGEDAQLVVLGRSIDIHTNLLVLQQAVGWENMRYEEPFVGGHFGITADITSDGITAAAAVHFRRAIRYVPSLAESMAMTSKRCASELIMKTGADENGRLTGHKEHVILDKGAYAGVGPAAAWRITYMCSGPYLIPAVKDFVQVVYTNNPWSGAARGAGPPKQNFALECVINMLADKAGIDRLEFRKRNALKVGEERSSGAPVRVWPFAQLCDDIKPHYERALRQAREHKTGAIRRGVGIAGSSFAIGGPFDTGVAAIEIDPDDGVTVYAGVADPGEGNESMLRQLAADGMDLPLDKVRLVTRDTARTPASGAAASSRMTYAVGGALVNAMDLLKKALAATGGRGYAGLKAAGKPVRFLGSKNCAANDKTPMDPTVGQGPNYEDCIHLVQLAEVEVNTQTGDVKVLKMTCAIDIGTIIHPLNVEGQLDGGIDQGVGWALREEFVAGKTKDWRTFKFPTMRTAMDVEYVFRETPRPFGPKGASGVGEATTMATAPAVISAIQDACGIWITSLPATPEKVKAALAAVK